MTLDSSELSKLDKLELNELKNSEETVSKVDSEVENGLDEDWG